MNSCGSAKRYAYMQDVELAKRWLLRLMVLAFKHQFPVFLLQIQAQEIVLPYKK